MSACPRKKNRTEHATPPPLREHEIHVWTISLNVPVDELRDMQKLLSPDETERALRFASPPLRRRHICAHAATRSILALYLDIEPREIAIGTEKAGKPFIEDPTNRGIHFNLSHTGDTALLAIARDAPVGVDVEAIRDLPEWKSLASRFLSEREVHQLHRLPENKQPGAFYHFWVRKEAYLKGIGTGIALGLPSFSVQIGRGFEEVHDPSCKTKWYVAELEAPEDFVAAIATPVGKPRLRYFEWD